MSNLSKKKTKEYYCNCSMYCKGRPVKVSRATYHRHSTYRSVADKPPPSNVQFSADFQKFLGTPRISDSSVVAPPAPITDGSSILLKRPIGVETSQDPTVLKRRRAGQPDISSLLEEEMESSTEVCTCKLNKLKQLFIQFYFGQVPADSAGTDSNVGQNRDDGAGIDDSAGMDDGAGMDGGAGMDNCDGGSPLLQIGPISFDQRPDALLGDSPENDADSGSDTLEHAPDPGSQALDGPQNNSGLEDLGQTEGIDVDELIELVQIDDIKLVMQYIKALENASLDDEMGLDPETIGRLRDAPQLPVDITDPDLRLSLDIFLSVSNSSQETYTSVRKAIIRRHPEDEILTYDQIRRRVAQLSGVIPLTFDMCINSCLAYTGPLSDLEACPECGENRYDAAQRAASGGKKLVPRQVFHTMPIGPQLQALWRNPDTAISMRYRDSRTQQIFEELERNNGELHSYDDFLHGHDYLEAVADGRIKPGDVVLMFSMDGAQLCRNKASDCWISIWVIFDLAPDGRYKKKCVRPGSIIPGPNKPKIFESFLYPGFHHLAALQKEGFSVWDSSRNTLFKSYPFLALGTADGPAMTYLNGLVGHHGKHGCRLYCSLTGRHKPGGSHYYPALLKPVDYHVEGCDHDDVELSSISATSTEMYQANLRDVITAPNPTQYKKRRLEAGISKPSIFLGFPMRSTLGVPACFGSDIMHLGSLNLPDILINLWRGTLDCDKGDSRSSWDWAVLQGDTWKSHGKVVAAATPHLPGSFDRPPRNPAEKINSGYKAWEYLMYLFGLGPGIFYNVLPDKYWRNFCKLVFGFRIINQYKIKTVNLCHAHQALLEFVEEFEHLYYQRRVDRLHFIRQSIHAVTHFAPETVRIGPGICSSQWTMERTIGNLGEEIRQPSNIYANLSQRALLRSQINTLKAMVPELEEPINILPRGAKDIGDGYVLLRAMGKGVYRLRDCEVDALSLYLSDTEATEGENGPESLCLSVIQWARLRLPNGQVARSAWKEKLKPLERIRTARNVKVSCSLPSLVHTNLVT
jgi:hypothetical protein